MIDRMDDAQFFEALNLPISWRQQGIEDCKKGIFKQGMPEAYNLGWQLQHEKSEKKDGSKTA
jgi:hypothetical protein